MREAARRADRRPECVERELSLPVPIPIRHLDHAGPRASDPIYTPLLPDGGAPLTSESERCGVALRRSGCRYVEMNRLVSAPCDLSGCRVGGSTKGDEYGHGRHHV